MPKTINANLIKLMIMLSDGQLQDGEKLGKQLKMTRSAVWKAIQKLIHYQVPIESVQGKGYVMHEPFILLEADKIKSQVKKKVAIEVFETLTSTNDYLKSTQRSNTIQICLAEQQTQGKGRLNREWYSPFGKNIYFSCRYPFQKDVSEMAGLSLVTSLAVLMTLKNYDHSGRLQTKWPNDIVYEGQKLSGSLVEIQAETHGLSDAVIGIGINVNMIDDDKSITQPWTSLQKIYGQYVDRNELTVSLINHLLTYLEQFSESGFPAFVDAWMQCDSLQEKMITLSNVDKKIKGKMMGVNEQGHLLLKLVDGSIRAFSSGDTSVINR